MKVCLEKLLNMGSIFEIIVVDDASIDKTEEVIKSFKNDKIRYFKNEKNLGIQKSYFNVLQKARGDYITFIADDDEYIDNNFFDKIQFYDEDIISAKKEIIFNGEYIKNDFFSQKDILNSREALEVFSQFSFGGNTVFKKEIICRVKQLNFEHDLSSVFFSLIFAKKIRFINEVVFGWRLNIDGESFSAKLSKSPYDLIKWDLKFLDEIIPVLRKEGKYEEYKWFINKRLFYSFENVEFNYYITSRKKYFDRLLKELDKEVYIYGCGQAGVLLKEFLQKNNIKVLGVIDDFKDSCLKLKDIDLSKQVIIATFKRSLIHKMYKNLLRNGVNYRNIKELL